MLANEVCHRAKLSPFAMTGKLGAEGAHAVREAIHACVADGLAYERTRTDMSSSADRPGAEGDHEVARTRQIRHRRGHGVDLLHDERRTRPAPPIQSNDTPP